jgi:hypothetical protein
MAPQVKMDGPLEPPAAGEGPKTRRRGSAYDREISAETTRHLSDEEYGRALDAARSFHHPTWFPDLDAAQVIEFVYLTGAHPAVLAQAQGHQLRAAVETDGVLHVRWTRPKKRGMAGEMDLPVAAASDPAAVWIPDLVAQLRARPYTTQHLSTLLRLVGAEAGVPLSFRALRHTCGVRIARESRDPSAVVAWLNCSLEVATRHYLRLASSRDPRFLALARGTNGRPAPGASPSPGDGGAGLAAGT